MFYDSSKRHIGGRVCATLPQVLPSIAGVEDGVAMHDLGSAHVPTVRLPAVTPGLARRGPIQQIGDRTAEDFDANQNNTSVRPFIFHPPGIDPEDSTTSTNKSGKFQLWPWRRLT